MSLKKHIANLLEEKNLKPVHRLGQNFLIENSVFDTIIETAELDKNDFVIEVGAGPGTLSEKLAGRCGQLRCLEIDPNYLPILKKVLKDFPNCEIIQENVLKSASPDRDYKVIANIPYYITSPILSHYLKEAYLKGEKMPKKMILLVQKEVAQKLAAKKDQSLLSLYTQLFGEVKIIRNVSAESFYPKPKVESCLIKINCFEKPLINCDLKKFFRIIEKAFSQKRKMLKNTIKNEIPEIETILKKLQIRTDIRPQNLNLSDWEKIINESY